MAKYSETDIVKGRKDLSNNAIAGYVVNDQGKLVWRIVKGGLPPKTRTRRPLSQQAAQRSFNKYWKQRYTNATSPASSRAYKAAWARDVNYGRPDGLRSNSSYKRNPGRLEYKGVDYGTKSYKAPSAKQLENLSYGRQILAEKREKTIFDPALW